MDFKKYNVLEFFDSSQKSFSIPVYQRAYSWEEKQWSAFLDDLLEQIKGSNEYFYGTVLLETIKKGVSYEIIDGQQRLTTLTIFIRALLNSLRGRDNTDTPEDFDFQTKERLYLKDGGNIKLRPVDYDKPFYDAVIIENNDSFQSTSLSQKRIKDAKLYFEAELKKIVPEAIFKILEKIETSVITVIELEGKKEASLMFELENNRGKDLSDMEKLKSYLMYQMYVYSQPEETESNIENISNIFKSIYLTINDLSKLREDSVLIYHNQAYIKGYNYRVLEDVKETFKKSDDKVKWIKAYVAELHTSFVNMKKFELSKCYYAKKLEELDAPAFVYPFLLKGYKFFGEDETRLNILFKILEVLAFRVKLINSRANIQERLNFILVSFEGDIISLVNETRKKLSESWYWGDINVKNHLHGNMYGNNALHYLLWQYENSIQKKGYRINVLSLDNEQIEHISPQTPTNGEPISTGYEINENRKYSEEFTEKYLNSIGNLMLISGSHNKSIGNMPFREKLESYKKNPLLNQQAEIEEFISDKNCPQWQRDSIIKRQKQIIDFTLKRWSLEEITTT